MLYGEYQDEEYYCNSNYDPIVKYFGNILVESHDDDYQGDSRYLIQSSGKYGFLIIGWGSCSGCDALQGCSNNEELNDLVNSLWNNIKWFDTKEEVLNYINSEDREENFYYHSEEWNNFVNEVNALFN